MHNNYYLLRQLTEELRPLLLGGVISECFSQNKEELVVRIELGVKSFYIKANLQPAFSCLSFPEVFHRAKKNSVDLFPDCIGLRITGVRQFTNERSFSLELNEDYSLLFKMHGNRSNALLFKGDHVHALFRNNLEADEGLLLSTLDKHIDWSKEAFSLAQPTLKSHYFTFGKIVWRMLEEEEFFSFAPEQQWLRLQDIKKRLEHPDYFIIRHHNSLALSLLNTGEVVRTENSPRKALTHFCQEYLQAGAYTQEKAKRQHQLQQHIAQAENYLTKTRAKLQEIEQDQHYKEWADLLMANLHLSMDGEEKITVSNFYNHNLPIEIKLKRELSLQKNAEVYYRKSKNQQIEINRLQKNIAEKEEEKRKTEAQLVLLQQADSLKELRTLIPQLSLPEKKEINTPLPYHEFTYRGYTIWVGRNAQANDILTLKHTYKEDLWLHAKDVAGSHVVVKYQAGKPFPKEVIERAAQLAAYNSKRKTESLAPVVYTPKKYVRKRKGDPAGMVVVEREDVILVEPKLAMDN